MKDSAVMKSDVFYLLPFSLSRLFGSALSVRICVFSLWHKEIAVSALFVMYISSQNLVACIYMRT